MSTEKKINTDNKQKTQEERLMKKEEQIATALRDNLLRRKMWIRGQIKNSIDEEKDNTYNKNKAIEEN